MQEQLHKQFSALNGKAESPKISIKKSSWKNDKALYDFHATLDDFLTAVLKLLCIMINNTK